MKRQHWLLIALLLPILALGAYAYWASQGSQSVPISGTASTKSVVG